MKPKLLLEGVKGGALIVIGSLLFTPAYGDTDIVKSPNDDRNYRALTLPNELQVLLVSDPATDKAAASMDVYVGSGSDPGGRQGLAHFLEHMLFLGTEKYPEPGAYQSFISAHGGTHNAYTAFDHTNYFFDVDDDYLEPALDRFSQFFVAPLFNPEYVERERNAVDSEFHLRKKSDGRRAYAAFKQAVNPKHPLSEFQVGSLETLSDRPGNDVRDDLIAFYRGHYSANVMALAVLGREPLDVLEGWVREKFAGVENRGATAPDIDEPLFEEGRLPLRLNVVPVKETRELSLTFPIPPLLEHYRTKPANYVAHLLGHEGEGSLLSLLKSKGWAEGLSAGPGVDHRNEATLDVSIKLTAQGLDHLDAIVSHVFEYVELIRDSGIQGWIFEEQQQLSEIDFRFHERQRAISYVRRLARGLQIYPRRDVLRGPYAMDEYDPELIRGYLDHLRPENVIAMVMANGVETTDVTPWFEAPYLMHPVASRTLAKWRPRRVRTALALPEPNEFIPEDLSVEPPRDVTPKPVRIADQAGFELWHRQDPDFREPRANFYFSVRSDVANDTPEHAMLTELYVKLVNEQLNEFTYPAQVAGLDYRLHKHIRGFTVRISGYDDKQGLLLERIVSALRDPQIPAERFFMAKQELTRALKNKKENSPYSQTMAEVSDLLIAPHWSERQRLEALEPLTAQDVRGFVPELLGEIHVVALAHGNLLREQAQQLGRTLERALREPARAAAVPGGKVVKLEPGARYVRELDVDHPDSALTLYFQGPDRSFERRAQAALLAQVMSAPFYHELRTEKQLGYVVFAQPMTLLDVPGIAFTVQSPVADPIDLERHVADFISHFTTRLEDMSPEQFDTHKRGLLTRILAQDERLGERTDRYWQEIDRERYEFDTREQLAAALRDIDKPDLERAIRELTLENTHKRLMVRAVGTRHEEAFAKKERASRAMHVFIQNPQAFKRDKDYFSWLKVSGFDSSSPLANAAR
ncbi:MAG: insulinase family protein [Gammaproteobacteria bacterium]|nr:insulinase family protein [Gammaproteobacteria bacterium]NIR84795.1 insulinase family protein [Gammaproteobacteria bacterium]NIR91509.1 insulinase family protein [Gammaproteobacteria bacterium]NIU05842.1 insulinase family protein [Gammaproteobacteria bacterium]NIV76697.1 peptidase M16 [Gammaproteobacteria bacterium]